MIIQNINNTTILKFSQILRDPRQVSKLPLPIKLCEKLKDNLINAQNSEKNEDNDQEQLEKEYYSTSLYVRILSLEALHRSLSYAITDKGIELYKHYFNKDFELKNLDDLQKKIRRLKLQFEVISEDTTAEDFDFDKYIAKIGILLDINLWDKMLYQLPKYEELAVTKIEENENDRTE